MKIDDIILKHLKYYPELTPIDLIKIIYQNEFGVGHFLPDEKRAFDFLNEEYKSIDKKINEPIIIELGNDMCRVSLNKINPPLLNSLFKAFVLTSRKNDGTKESFLEKIKELSNFVNDNINLFSFTYFDFEKAVDGYINSGINVLSHSDEYRTKYHPHYRVVSLKVINMEEFNEIK